MKSIVRRFSSKQTRPAVLALVVLGILAVEVHPALTDTAAAKGDIFSKTSQIIAGRVATSARLPRSIANAVRQDLAAQLGIPRGQVRIVESSQQTWPACLGLPRDNERCGDTTVEGWRVVASYDNQTWIYRTDNTGSMVRVESQSNSVGNLPSTVANTVLQEVARQRGLPVSTLRIVWAEQQEWPDGCLGFPEPGVACTEAIVPGWLVRVENGQQVWFYRTNDSGSLVKQDILIDPAPPQGLRPVEIPSGELPPAVGRNVVFRAIATGGFTGFTYETTLLEDGRVIKVQLNGAGSGAQPQTYRISRQQVRQFQQLLDRQNLSQFNRLSYPAPSGAADYITVTLSSATATTRYADMVESQLPSALQEVIQSWNQIANRG